LKVAETLMQMERFGEALQAYQCIRARKEVLAMLVELIAKRDRGIASLTRRGRFLPARLDLQLERHSLQREGALKMKATLEKEANYDAVLYYRIGRCFAALERYWEARLAFRQVYDAYPGFEERPNVLYALASSYYMLTPENPAEDKLKLCDEADKLLVEFLTKYGKDRSESAQAADMRVKLTARTKDPVRLDKVFEEVEALLKGSPNQSAIRAQRIHACLGRGDFDKARVLCANFLKEAAAEDPQRKLVEEMAALIPPEKK
jgi:hypothetical protein